jgi:cyanophycin synthetase
MVKVRSTNTIRINARKTDVFDLFNFRYYVGPNPYLETRSLVFDFALTDGRQPLAIAKYAAVVGDRYPHLADKAYDSYADLCASLVAEVGKLIDGLQVRRWSIKYFPYYARIGMRSLHEDTTKAIVYLVWDWLESITQDQEFSLELKLSQIQADFSKSVYGQPAVSALVRQADTLGIPNFYLETEDLTQYGYGKKQVRSRATTFDRSSSENWVFQFQKVEGQIRQKSPKISPRWGFAYYVSMAN